MEQERATFDTTLGLTVGDGHLGLPDLRLELEWSDGRRNVRDIALSHGSFEEHVIQHRHDRSGALPAIA